MTAEVSDLLRQARQYSQSGQLETAMKKYNRILALEPENPAVYFELGVIALKRGRHGSAVDFISRAIEIDSGRTHFHNVLGIAYSSLGNLPEGARCFQQAIELDPGNASAHNNLGTNYKDQGKWSDAVGCYRKSISLNPQNPDASINLGELLQRHGELDAAEDVYRKALSLNADHAQIQYSLALTLLHMQNYQEAVTIFREIAASRPDFPSIHIDLGAALMRLGHFGEAIAGFRTAIARKPDFAQAHNNLGSALLAWSDPAGAIASLRNALKIAPDYARAHSNLLLALNYLPETTQQELYQESLQFDLQHADGLLQTQPDFHNPREKDRVLRIGYVSADFRSHSVAHFTRKLLGAHNRDRVEVFCYANVMKQDQITNELQVQADHWLSITGMGDQEVADRIRKDQIDILIDLAGHTANSRLLVFAHKPAPVQVNWLGYPNTTGLACMDYRLTDSIADPPGVADRLHAEKLVRLPHGFLCYQTDEPIPSVSPPRCLERGHVTFGSFNHLPKITPDVIRVWSRILKRVPDARLVLKSGPLVNQEIKEKCAQMFVEQGISPDRLDLLGMCPSKEEHLRMYGGIDIGLDPFPYNGTTTTLEALWMGVPVICLRGDRHAGRVGASILHHAGLPELIAENEDEYINLATELAGDAQRLITLHKSLRTQLRESMLMDVPLFTETLENAYRRMWLAWCESEEPHPL